MIGALGVGVKETIQKIERIFGKGDWGKRIVGEMQKTMLTEKVSFEKCYRDLYKLKQTRTFQDVIYIRVGPHGGHSSNNEKLDNCDAIHRKYALLRNNGNNQFS